MKDLLFTSNKNFVVTNLSIIDLKKICVNEPCCSSTWNVVREESNKVQYGHPRKTPSRLGWNLLCVPSSSSLFLPSFFVYQIYFCLPFPWFNLVLSSTGLVPTPRGSYTEVLCVPFSPMSLDLFRSLVGRVLSPE